MGGHVLMPRLLIGSILRLHRMRNSMLGRELVTSHLAKVSLHFFGLMTTD